MSDPTPEDQTASTERLRQRADEEIPMTRTRFRHVATALGAAALALALVGCGGEESSENSAPGSAAASSTAPAEALSADEFIAQANAICEAQNAAELESFQAAQQAFEAGDTAGADVAVKRGASVIRGEGDAIAELAVPEELAVQVAALLTALNDGLDKIEVEGVQAVVSGALNDAASKASELGLTECGD